MSAPALDVAGHGPAVLLVHAFPLDRRMWSEQVQLVGARGRTALAPDLPGFGAAPVPTSAPPTLDAYVDALAALLVAHGHARATLVGLSLGGYVALRFARRFPERLEGLVLADTRATADAPAARAARESNLALLRSGDTGSLLERVLGPLLSPHAPAALRERVRALAAGQAPAGVAYALAAMRDREDSTALLPSLRVPTLVLAGEHDTLTPPAELRALAAAIPGARFAEVAGAGHLSNLEQPAAFGAELARFLDETAASRRD